MAKARDYKEEFVLEMIPVEKLSVHPENPKLHPQTQLEALDASIQDFGWLVPLVWNKRTGRILDGHGRFETEGNRGRTVFPCRVVDVDEPTERRIIASLDRVGEMRTYDDAALVALLERCTAEGGVLPGWSDDNIEDLLAANRPTAPKVAATKVSSNTAEAGEVPGSVAEVSSSANPNGGPGDVRQPAAVRMVQLFFSPEEHEEFETLVGQLAETFGVNTPSDVVLTALREGGS